MATACAFCDRGLSLLAWGNSALLGRRQGLSALASHQPQSTCGVASRHLPGEVPPPSFRCRTTDSIMIYGWGMQGSTHELRTAEE